MEATSKRGPGRPKKTPKRAALPKTGISNAPLYINNNVLEFTYDKPIVFKKLWTYFKAMAIEKILTIFRPNEVIFYGEDHYKKSQMRVHINVHKINHYYLKDEFNINLVNKKLELIMSTIDKTYNSVIFMSKSTSVGQNIKIVLNNDVDIAEEYHTIELTNNNLVMKDESLFLDEDYPIKFELPARYFKKMISDVRSFSDELSIKQEGQSQPLVFEYVTADKKIRSENIVKNNKNIKFTSKIAKNNIFKTTFKVDYVKPVSSALLADSITIYASEEKQLMFKIDIDDAIDLRILTDIM